MLLTVGQRAIWSLKRDKFYGCFSRIWAIIIDPSEPISIPHYLFLVHFSSNASATLKSLAVAV